MNAKENEKDKYEIELEKISRELDILYKGGIIDIMIRNYNVDSFVKELENRVKDAEKSKKKIVLKLVKAIKKEYCKSCPTCKSEPNGIYAECKMAQLMVKSLEEIGEKQNDEN